MTPKAIFGGGLLAEQQVSSNQLDSLLILPPFELIQFQLQCGYLREVFSKKSIIAEMNIPGDLTRSKMFHPPGGLALTERVNGTCKLLLMKVYYLEQADQLATVIQSEKELHIQINFRVNIKYQQRRTSMFLLPFGIFSSYTYCLNHIYEY